MLKRHANRRAPPQPAVRRRVGLLAPRAAASPTVDTTTAAWRRAACPAERERAALEHYEQLGRQAHPVCQICQEAIRARLHHESIRSRARAQLQHTPPPPVAAVPRSAPAAAAAAAAAAAHTVTPPTPVSPYAGSSTSSSTGSDSYGFPSVSSIFSGPSPDPTVSSVSSDGTLPGTGGALWERQPLHWADVGKEAWEEYWDTRSDVSAATTASRDSGRVPDGFVERARSIAAARGQV